jgi:hypothetical protein
MTQPIADPAANAKVDVLTKAGHAAVKIVKDSAEAVTGSGHASTAAFKELAEAYQELATRNARNLTTAIQAISAVKTPAELFEVQQKLMKEVVEAAVGDSQKIAALTLAVFTAAFEPLKKQFETLQKTTLN